MDELLVSKSGGNMLRGALPSVLTLFFIWSKSEGRILCRIVREGFENNLKDLHRSLKL